MTTFYILLQTNVGTERKTTTTKKAICKIDVNQMLSIISDCADETRSDQKRSRACIFKKGSFFVIKIVNIVSVVG